MSRHSSALLLLLGLSSPGAAQAPSPVPWTLAIGDFTIYGRTTYTPTIVLRPRIVYDTTRGVDSARVVDSVRAAATVRGGFAAGLGTWPTEAYCSGPMSAAMQQVDPRVLLARLQLAARCGGRAITQAEIAAWAEYTPGEAAGRSAGCPGDAGLGRAAPAARAAARLCVGPVRDPEGRRPGILRPCGDDRAAAGAQGGDGGEHGELVCGG